MNIYKKNIRQILKELPDRDKDFIDEMEKVYGGILTASQNRNRNQTLIDLYTQMGKRLRDFIIQEDRLHVFSFTQPQETHGQISRLIAKLRSVDTPNIEFIYYMQRAYEALFNFGFREDIQHRKNHFIIETPVTLPSTNYAVHKLPNLDESLHNTVVCVMLRAALLPSLIIAKEIQEYSSIGYTPEFALFRISRNDHRDADDMEYIIKEKLSFFNPDTLQGKDLIFPDPMNATGGSLITVLEYLRDLKVKPKSIKLFHAISSLKGALQVIRNYDNVEIYTLWIDPALNHKAYIMPGLGDAGDRIHGKDEEGHSRNLLQLIAQYGQNILQLYRLQIQKIEESVLGKME